MARPIVDGLAREAAGEVDVLRVSVASPAGRALGNRWRARAVPTFLLFDQAGREVWRTFSVPTVDALRERLRAE
jgi:hypothetical protein